MRSVSSALAILVFPGLLLAQTGEPVSVDLRELLKRAETHYPEVAVAAAEQASAEATRDLARWTRFSPRLTSRSVFGVVPGAEGDIFNSPDTPRDLNDLGPFWRTRVDASIPVYAFGAMGAAERAARRGVDSRVARSRAKLNAGRLLAARAYFGYLLATESLALLADVRGHLEKLLESLEHPSEEQDVDPLDLYKARSYGFDLDKLEAEARKGLKRAAAGLQELAGEPVRPAAAGLVGLGPGAVPDLEGALATALSESPEVREAEMAAEARGLVAESARKERLPALAVEGRFEYGEAPGRARQDNPFVYDPFNTRTLSAALGLRWDLNFKQSGARARREQAEAEVQRARAAALKAKLRLELRDLHASMTEAHEIHETSRRALSTSANWLRLAEENHGIGTASTKDVIDAYGAYVRAKAAHLTALHDLDVAVIAWRLAFGRPPLEEGETP